MASKGWAQVLRLAGTLALLNCSLSVKPEPTEIQGGMSLRQSWDYYWPHARVALRQIGCSERHVNARKALELD